MVVGGLRIARKTASERYGQDGRACTAQAMVGGGHVSGHGTRVGHGNGMRDRVLLEHDAVTLWKRPPAVAARTDAFGSNSDIDPDRAFRHLGFLIQCLRSNPMSENA
jgi:hypothetical protein